MANKHSLCTFSHLVVFLVLLHCRLFAWAQRESYIVHMDSSAMPRVFPDRHNWFRATLSSVSRTSERLTLSLDESISSSQIIYSYTHAIDGFSARFTQAELDSLRNTPGFIEATRDLPVQYDTTRSIQFLGLDSNSEAWKLSNMGEGIIIGVVDTGVWPESESFKDDGMPAVPARWKGKCESGTKFNSSLCNRKLIGARYFNKGILSENITLSMNSARDTDGHGTHTSSTAAGSFVPGASYFGYAPGTVRGVAPKAHVAIYKAIWDEGSTTSDIIAAIDQAIMDGVDVISLSFGLDVALYKDPVAIACLAAVQKNIFVSTSAGNRGPEARSLHNGTPWLLTVAAGNMDREFQGVLNLGNRQSVLGSSLYVGKFPPGDAPMVIWDAATNFTVKGADKKIIVCIANSSKIEDVVSGVDLNDSLGVAIISDISQLELELYIKTRFPSIFISSQDGATVLDYVRTTKKPRGSMVYGKTRLGVLKAPTLSGFSSRGPSPSCPSILKPDIMAPGDNILAAWPPKVSAALVRDKTLNSKFNMLSGTSMSCPHAAGVAALIKKAHPEWSPAAIRSAMMTTADTLNSRRQPIEDTGLDSSIPADPLGMGSGHVNPNKAMNPGLVYDLHYDDYVKLVCAMNFTAARTRIILRSAKYNCSGSSLDINYPSMLAFVNGSNSAQVFHRTLTNVGKARSSYSASMTPMEGCKVTVIPEKLDFSAINEKKSFKVVIEPSAELSQEVTAGYLRWVSDGGEYTVSTPIVAAMMKATPDFDL